MGNQESSSSSIPAEHVTNKTTERGSSSVQNIQFAVSGMKGLRNTMEDEHLYATNIPVPGEYDNPLSDHSIFAVFDGHGGAFTSEYLKENLMSVLAARPEMRKYANLPKTGPKSRADVNGLQYLKQALVGTFLELDRKLIPLQIERTIAMRAGQVTPNPDSDSEDEDSVESSGVSSESTDDENAGERSGSTGIVVVVTPTHMLCANTGDSRAMLRRDGKVLPLSFDHKPTNLPERLRITDANGIIKSKRVDGDLAVSRAFGDYVYKVNESLTADKQKVTAVPDLISYPRNIEQDEFFVLACDGIWDVATNNECSEFVQSLLSEGETDLGNIAEEALDTCLERHSRDNMTLMLVALPGLKADSSSSAAMRNAIWGQRSARRAKQAQNQAQEVSRQASNMANKALLRLADEIGIEV